MAVNVRFQSSQVKGMSMLRGSLRLACLAITLAIATQAKAQDTIRAISAFPASSGLGSDFQMFIKMVNEAGEGVVQIDHVGGPEVAPPSEQGTMLSNGLVDMVHTPPIYFAGRFPEAEIFAAKLRSAAEIRADGGVELYNAALGPRLNSRLIAFADGDYGLFIMTTKKPGARQDGLPDLSGFRLRGTKIYENLFASLGASSLIIPFGETYTALERGMVDGVGYTLADVESAGWADYLKFVITPRMYGGSSVIMMNNRAYDRLSEASKKLLSEIAVRYEGELKEHYKRKEADALARLKELGLSEIALEGDTADAFVDLSVSTYREKLNAGSYNIDLAKALKIYAGE